MPKRLILCCDGTWNTPDQKVDRIAHPTNVARLALSIAPVDSTGMQQCTYYHQGVGTSRWDHLRGGAFGVGLSANVLDAYHFLIDNYEPGDQLWFFGFSRGAFTARSVAGLVRNCGVLRSENLDRMGEAYRLYRSRAQKPRGVASVLFRHTYSHEPRVRFIGVWDTVGALGIPVTAIPVLKQLVNRFNRRWAFHDTDLSTFVDGAFQALAIDEHRAAFGPTLWKQQPGACSQALEQVWFPGVHCDVGGGLEDTALSDVALVWMFDKARAYGLELTRAAFAAHPPVEVSPGDSAQFELAPDLMGQLHESRKGFYRLVPSVDRQIGTAPRGHECVAFSAERRYRTDPAYQKRSENLRSYLARPAGARIAHV